MKLSRGVLSISLLLVMMPIVGCGSPTNTATNAKQNISSSIEAGDNAVVNTANDLTAVDKNSLTELQNDVSASNAQDVQTMVDNGKVLQLPKGTKAYVEDVSFDGIVHIRIDSGDYSGQQGYIPYEQLTKVK